jgi:allantoicase
LDPGSQNFYSIEDQEIFTHLRLHIYPDGGVARLKVYGEVFKKWDKVGKEERLDLASALNGGKALACNDMFFSSMGNLIMPGRGINMGDGWETKRSRTPNNRDWVILKLAIPGYLDEFEVDTAFFKGNYPDRCSIEACSVDSDEAALSEQTKWDLVLGEQKLRADVIHFFPSQKIDKTFTHIRLNIFPDGGISRLRAWGRKGD